MIFDDVTIRTRVDGRDCGFHRRDASNEQKEGIGRNLFGEFQEVDAGSPGHAHVGNNNVKNLRFELALGGFDAVGDLDAMALFAKRNFEEFANGALIIDDEDVNQFAVRFLCHCFRSLH